MYSSINVKHSDLCVRFSFSIHPGFQIPSVYYYTTVYQDKMNGCWVIFTLMSLYIDIYFHIIHLCCVNTVLRCTTTTTTTYGVHSDVRL